MNKQRLTSLVLVLAAVCSLSVQAQPLEFSIDPLSPEPWSPADILIWNGSGVRIPAADLGLHPTNDVDAFSYGEDEIEPLSYYYFVRVAYSVRRGAVGDGGAVERQASGNGAAGDKFQIAAVGVGGIFYATASMLLSDAPEHGLTPNDISELDALALNRLGTTNYPVYYSVAPNHPAWGPADIVMVRSNGAHPELFASAAQLGLVPGDDIDALAIGTVPPGRPPLQLGPGVVVWISLSNGSPSRIAVGLDVFDGVMQVYPGPHQVALDGESFDLAPGDDLDALAGLDPGPSLSAKTAGGLLILEWWAPTFVLESAGSLEGPYTEVEGARSPHSVPMTEKAQFFRIRATEFGICYEARGCLEGSETAWGVEKNACRASGGRSWKGGVTGCTNL